MFEKAGWEPGLLPPRCRRYYEVGVELVVYNQRGRISPPAPVLVLIDGRLPPEVGRNPSDAVLKELLEASKTVAVVGLSPKPDRDSHQVALYLKRQGYRVVPVYPREDFILGERVFRTLGEIPFRVDIVDVFRRSEETLPVVEEAVRLRPRAVWLQLGVVNEAAVLLCEAAGVTLIMDRCIMVEHRRLCGGGS
ncbi:MAG: CoA-binding protein [Bacillota bacterium]